MTTIAESIAAALAEGLETPPELVRDHKLPAQLHLPGLRTAKHMPQPYADAVNAATQAISESIVHLIEKDHDIVPAGEYAQMRDERDALRAEVTQLRTELETPELQAMGEGSD
jgi:hypothetical protein